MASPLEQKICHLAEANDQLTYAEFVDAALYDLEHGYYKKSQSRVGRRPKRTFTRHTVSGHSLETSH